ncbi:peroxidase 55-like [Macadamia integrifolia]|uniref:peroxidase 55-like n=1 Tax=Macadamia integrifolia TaxID=60698 RepID=UPI001C4F2422|nr:peroxidase 55-like [Macadamia integrifolia]
MGSLVFWVLLLGSLLPPRPLLSSSNGLSVNFYGNTCPNVENFIWNALVEKMREPNKPNITLPGTLRLFFHDCFVEGCDGSVLITSTANDAERYADINKSLPPDGFDIVIRAKKAVEAACPGVVSCADILAILARDVVYYAKGPWWPVEMGRRDGRISKAAHAADQVPSGYSNLTDLIVRFQFKGLSKFDLVTVSGAHNLGSTHCIEFADRIRQHDPILNETLRAGLIKGCPYPKIDPLVVIPFHEPPFQFDNEYYKSLMQNKGLLTSDQALFSGGDEYIREMVLRFAGDKELFFKSFGNAMQRLGAVGVKTGTEGEIRRECTSFN